MEPDKYYENVENNLTQWSRKKKILVVSFICLAVAIIITGVILLIVFLSKPSKKNLVAGTNTSAKNTHDIDEDIPKSPGFAPPPYYSTIKPYDSGRNDAMNDIPKQTFTDQSVQTSYNKGYDEFMVYWNANHVKRESAMMTTGVIASLKGNPDESSSLSIRDKKPYIEGYNKTNEEILQMALSDGLNDVSYGSRSAGTGVFTIYIGNVIKNEYIRGNNVAKGAASGDLPNTDGFLPRVVEILQMAYDKGFSDGTAQ